MPARRELTAEQWAMLRSLDPKEAAKQFGVGLSTVYSWLSGTRRPVVKPEPVTRYYGPVRVDWTPSEAAMLDRIKSAKMERRILDVLEAN